MRKYLFSLSLIIFSGLQAFATGDSLHYLTPKDTIFLQVDDFGNKIFTHRLEKGQTLFSLARFYGLKVNNLLDYNPDLDLDRSFHEGMAVHIPIPDSAILKTWEYGFPKAGYVPVQYKVRRGDTFYRIAKHYFNIPLDTLKNWNGLESTLLYSGNILHIGYLSMDGIPDSLQLSNTSPLGGKMLQLKQQFDFRAGFQDPVFQNGAAYWLREKKGGNDYYCLHRTAPVGSVIKIYNPMHKKTVYAKVIAPVPDRAYGDDIIIVLSPSIAKLLRVRDAKFYVEIYYFGN